jgi:hypothetical protein
MGKKIVVKKETWSYEIEPTFWFHNRSVDILCEKNKKL